MLSADIDSFSSSFPFGFLYFYFPILVVGGRIPRGFSVNEWYQHWLPTESQMLNLVSKAVIGLSLPDSTLSPTNIAQTTCPLSSAPYHSKCPSPSTALVQVPLISSGCILQIPVHSLKRV